MADPAIPTDTPSPSITTQSPPTLTIPPTIKATPETPPTTIAQPTTTTPLPSQSRTPTTSPTLYPGTPMGEGVLVLGMHPAEQMGSFAGNQRAWQTYDHLGRRVIVYLGVYTSDKEQGVLYIVREGTIWNFYGDRVEIPTRSGRPRIIDVIGKRLIIQTEGGDTFYFDVPSGKIAPNLTATLPTMTPGPTLTPRTSPTPRSGDDVPNHPRTARVRSLNEDLKYFIDPSGDEDWFEFALPSSADVTVSLKGLPDNYGLIVLLASNYEELGRNMEPSTSDKIIYIPDAETGFYYVGIIGINDAHSSNKPYTLRFSTE